MKNNRLQWDSVLGSVTPQSGMLPLDQLEEASTHKSAKIHDGNVFVNHDLDRRSFDPKINEFPELTVERFCIKFSDPSCIDLQILCRKNRQTHRQVKTQTLLLPSPWVIGPAIVAVVAVNCTTAAAAAATTTTTHTFSF